MIQPLPLCIVAADIYVCMHTVTNDKITVWITVSGSWNRHIKINFFKHWPDQSLSSHTLRNAQLHIVGKFYALRLVWETCSSSPDLVQQLFSQTANRVTDLHCYSLDGVLCGRLNTWVTSDLTDVFRMLFSDIPVFAGYRLLHVWCLGWPLPGNLGNVRELTECLRNCMGKFSIDYFKFGVISVLNTL